MEEKVNQAEAEVELEAKKAEIAALVEFREVTKPAWETYMSVWKPAREAWEAFSEPRWKRLQARLTQIQKEKEEGLARLRANWASCPRCGASVARFQRYCSNKQCESSLPLEEELENE